MIEIAYTIFLLFVAASFGCCLWRLLRGPTLADRINAADVLALSCVALAMAHGWMRGATIWLDIAVVAGLMLFVGTTAVSLYLNPNQVNEPEE